MTEKVCLIHDMLLLGKSAHEVRHEGYGKLDKILSALGTLGPTLPGPGKDSEMSAVQRYVGGARYLQGSGATVPTFPVPNNFFGTCTVYMNCSPHNPKILDL